MTRAQKTVRVTPIQGEALRYHVQSWSDPQHPHLVDLSEHGGNGECSCKDFATRRWPAIRDGATLFTDETSCRHIKAARWYWMKHSLEDAAKLLNKQKGQKQ